MITARTSSFKHFVACLSCVSKVGHIFSENNKCSQGSAVSHSIKEHQWPAVCFSCRGVQAELLIMTVHTTFLGCKTRLFLLFHYLLYSFSDCIVDRKKTVLFFLGATDTRVKLFAWSNAHWTVSSSAFAKKNGWIAGFVIFHRANQSEISGFQLNGQRN
jgi:hypothetical protein